MLIVRVNTTFLREMDENNIVETNDFYPNETFNCEYVGGDFVRLSNARREAYIPVEFVNKNMKITNIDETIYGSKLQVSGKVIKNFLRTRSGVHYVVYSNNTRTMYIKEDGIYTVDAKVGYRLDFTEIDVEVVEEKTPFSANFENKDVKKAVDWAEKKINEFRTFNAEEQKGNDLGLDIMFNTAVSVTKELLDVGSKKGKELLEKLPTKEEIQKFSSEGVQKVNTTVNKTVNVIKEKKEQIERKIQTHNELTIEELLKMDGQPVWFVVNEDIFPVKDKTGWGLVAVRNENEVLLTTNNATFSVSLNKDFIKLYKNEVFEPVMPIPEDLFVEENKEVTLNKEEITKNPCEEDLPPLDIDDLVTLQKMFNISFVFAKEALDKTNGNLEEAKEYIKARLGK